MELNQLLDLSAENTLALRNYFDVFPNSLDGIDRVQRKLRSRWHPDKVVGDKSLAEKVFHHVETLADTARAQIKAGVWGKYKKVVFETPSSEVMLSCLRQDSLPGMGTQFTGRRIVGYEVLHGNADLLGIWVKNLARLKIGVSKDMLEDGHLHAATQLEISKVGPLSNTNSLLVVKKDPGFLCLRHILDAKKSLPPEHVVWVLTRLYNLCCLMQIRNIPNIDISPQSVFISAATHSVILPEGWQYAEGFGVLPKALPTRTAHLCPTIQGEGALGIEHCLTLVKAVGREALGDPAGVRVLANKLIPRPFTKWLVSPAGNDAIKELTAWKKARDEAYGKPKWQEMKLSEDDIY